jgi:hypothetical protein
MVTPGADCELVTSTYHFFGFTESDIVAFLPGCFKGQGRV